ncbi:MAG: universal stress protein [Bacteroidetes bacterium]|nr:universal stress protein [Bacteroidota bacterium]
MVIMGSTGTTATERFITGSNALRVANNAPCKVMLVPAKARFDGLEKIVYTTDLTNENMVQARELFPLAKKFDSEIVVLHIDSAGNKNDEEVLTMLTRKSKQFISYRKKSGYVCSDDDVTKGIDYFLKKQKADCLVVYHRHRNVLGAIFSKSVTQRVALLNNLPIIILHADDIFN